jgi:hypothetical protein
MSQENRAVVMPLLPGSRSWRSLEKDNLQQLVPVVHANRWRQQGWRQQVPRRRPPLAGLDCSVNSARVQPHSSGVGITLTTTARVNEAGAFQGGGSGNKAIYGACGLDLLPLAELQHLLIVWQNQAGPAGPHVEPAQAVTVATPYLNLLVDLNAADAPAGADIRVLVCCCDQLSPAISEAIGVTSNDGSNRLTVRWQAGTHGVLIVGYDGSNAPGGISPVLSNGSSWMENVFSLTDLLVACPQARLVDAVSGDGGLPAAERTPALLLCSGDSGYQEAQSKWVERLEINGRSLLP